MKISIIGSGYVGLVTGACLAETGNEVILVDISEGRVGEINAGKCPIYEPGLQELLQKHIGSRLKATTNAQEAIFQSEIIFICVGTPQSKDGSTDMQYVISAAKSAGIAIRGRKDAPIIILKSTTPPTKIDEVVLAIENSSGKKDGEGFYFFTNPEFLREGSAVKDFQKPDRIVVGCSEGKSSEMLARLYSPFGSKMFFCSSKSAMMVKYASNSFLAAKISFANEIGNICKKLGIDSHEVANGMALDRRINRAFLDSGCGFGGSCLPKDTASLAFEAKMLGECSSMLSAVLEVNKNQPSKVIERLKTRLGSFSGKKIAVLGLAFKPGTDDIRESPGMEVAFLLHSQGAKVFAYDPKATENAKKHAPALNYCKSAKEAIEKSEAAVIMTDWKEFAEIDTEKYVLEGKRILKLKKPNYEGICW
ncbi:UDP-glucose 6-dehydrogenase [Candidatus Micrarchaeota archaeon CG11_big_fil_rev_8_21_14_0_20_47_5]|nr:MAG: hypothetical protein AUJ17_05065 [Candidatus Micrarchaeota archaeon CG1_02_47_40]PIN82594.1 MAG: UDP-glucose 6-dehydrogenase [Candidatus Micrarchaeota archaeon CG11_big_fil_rev_8_21_14_0_20_47_5]